MSEYLTKANEAGEKYLTTLAKTQHDFVEAVATAIKQLPSTPDLPALPLPALPGISLPTVGEISTASFDFAEKLLTQARTYADTLIGYLNKAQESYTDAVSTVTKQIPNSDKLPTLPAVELPTPAEITAITFDFAEKLVAQQRAAAAELIKVVAPAASTSKELAIAV